MTKYKHKAGSMQKGESILIEGFRRPFRVISKTGDHVIVKHAITGARLWLSPGWPCLPKN
jgi:hypothetical protein